jgi:hypothetical protein
VPFRSARAPSDRRRVWGSHSSSIAHPYTTLPPARTASRPSFTYSQVNWGDHTARATPHEEPSSWSCPSRKRSSGRCVRPNRAHLAVERAACVSCGSRRTSAATGEGGDDRTRSDGDSRRRACFSGYLRSLLGRFFPRGRTAAPPLVARRPSRANLAQFRGSYDGDRDRFAHRAA